MQRLNKYTVNPPPHILGGVLLVALLAGLFPPPPILAGEREPAPLSFEDAARMAVEASLELRSQYIQRALKEGAWRAGLRAYLPRLSLSVSEDDRLSLTGSDSFQKAYSVSLDQLLWDGGRTSSSREVERAGLAVLGSELEYMASGIAASALTAYRRVLFLRMLLEIREASAASLDEERRILAEECRLGLALESDLAEAELTSASAFLEQVTAKLDLVEAELAFAGILGQETLPPLAESVDLQRGAALPGLERSVLLAREQNPSLLSARLGIARRQAEARLYERSWFPTIRVNTGLSLSGNKYPLTRSSWTVGLTINFSSPLLSGTVSGSAGWDPPYDRSMRLGSSASLLEDPAGAITGKSSGLALALEMEQYRKNFTDMERTISMALEKCRILDRRRTLSLEAASLAARRTELSVLRLSLGQTRRIDLMDDRLEQAEAEIRAVEAAVSLLEAERELEELLALKPGGLGIFARREENSL
ncbi:MAG: TolC family protein [Spirochaetaceae bacterium]|jgi:outer membrane protein TolC|nr:TolC family protein [Spirochaetaceae bacterium]